MRLLLVTVSLAALATGILYLRPTARDITAEAPGVARVRSNGENAARFELGSGRHAFRAPWKL